MTKYLIVLPENLPLSYNGNSNMHEAYREADKVQVTDSPTPKRARSNGIYRALSPTGMHNLVRGLLRKEGKSLGERVYEFPSKAPLERSIPRSRARLFQDMELALDLAEMSGIRPEIIYPKI